MRTGRAPPRASRRAPAAERSGTRCSDWRSSSHATGRARSTCDATIATNRRTACAATWRALSTASDAQAQARALRRGALRQAGSARPGEPNVPYAAQTSIVHHLGARRDATTAVARSGCRRPVTARVRGSGTAHMRRRASAAGPSGRSEIGNEGRFASSRPRVLEHRRASPPAGRRRRRPCSRRRRRARARRGRRAEGSWNARRRQRHAAFHGAAPRDRGAQRTWRPRGPAPRGPGRPTSVRHLPPQPLRPTWVDGRGRGWWLLGRSPLARGHRRRVGGRGAQAAGGGPWYGCCQAPRILPCPKERRGRSAGAPAAVHTHAHATHSARPFRAQRALGRAAARRAAHFQLSKRHTHERVRNDVLLGSPSRVICHQCSIRSARRQPPRGYAVGSQAAPELLDERSHSSSSSPPCQHTGAHSNCNSLS